MPTARFAFSGMNNRLDAAQLPAVPQTRGLYRELCADLVNVDTDSSGKARRRTGRRLVYPGAVHSLFAHKEYCLFGEGRYLKRLYPGMGTETLAELLSAAPLFFCATPVGIAVSNRDGIGLADDAGYEALPVPEATVKVDGISVPSFKEVLPGGEYCAWYAGMLYTLRREEDGDAWLYHTDGYSLFLDTRENYLRFPGAPTLLAAVEDGLYLGAGEKLYFLAGGGPDEFTEKIGADLPVVPGCFQAGTASELGIVEILGRPAAEIGRLLIAFGTEGFIYGLSGGNLLFLGEIAPAAGGERGALLIRRARGEVHFVASVSGGGAPDNAYLSPALSVETLPAGRWGEGLTLAAPPPTLNVQGG